MIAMHNVIHFELTRRPIAHTLLLVTIRERAVRI